MVSVVGVDGVTGVKAGSSEDIEHIVLMGTLVPLSVVSFAISEVA